MSRKHGWGAARPLKQGSGNYCTAFDARFVFQFSRDVVGPLHPRCMYDPACAYPAVEGQFCRAHQIDSCSVLSLTRIRTGHSWVRHHTKAAEVYELISFWHEWLREFRKKSTFIYSMSGVKGLDHPQAKLSDEEVQAIRRELRAKEDYALIAEKYGISRSHVSVIAKGGYRTNSTENLGWTHEDRAARSRRVAAQRWAAYREQNKERIEARMRTVHEMRQQGISWRQIGRKFGVAYTGLGVEYRKFYGLESMTPSQAGRKRAKMPTYACADDVTHVTSGNTRTAATLDADGG